MPTGYFGNELGKLAGNLHNKFITNLSHGDFEVCVNLLQSCYEFVVLSCGTCCKLADLHRKTAATLLQIKIAIWEWLKSINRADFVPSATAVVCIKNFSSQFIIKEDRVVRDDGSELVVPRKIPKLADDAYPSIFANQPFHLSHEPSGS
ncbi:hypothetical protein AVEN_53378-1 [Araneus ventricosus]|uniref:Uncharacterized protein n=1 Tax=Araneus ventricosus TaxID=182803 RepID=A0A4Y2AAG3_ARAVE|nr:hypothetical protein AVEN_53378-1 [Araneus ventricosus]